VAGLTVLDASVLLAHFDDTDPHSEGARAILADADRLAASTITLAETLVGATAAGRLDEQLRALSDLEIIEVPLSTGSAAALARLRVDTGLRMPDCYVLYAAATANANAVGTRHGRLQRAAAARGFDTP
jgi:predicted nucleic acid-binding protein